MLRPSPAVSARSIPTTRTMSACRLARSPLCARPASSISATPTPTTPATPKTNKTFLQPSAGPLPITPNPGQIMRTVDRSERDKIHALHPNEKYRKLFEARSPTRVQPGSIIRVDYQSNLEATRPHSIIGVLLGFRSAGIASSIKLRYTALKTPVEQWFCIYSPKVKDIAVLRENDLFKQKGKGYFMRHEPHDYEYSKRTEQRLKKLYSRVDDLNKAKDYAARQVVRAEQQAAQQAKKKQGGKK